MPSPDTYGTVADYGFLGIAVLALAALALRLWKDLQGSWANRLSETRELVQVVNEATATYRELAAATTARAEAMQALANATEKANSRIAEVHGDLMELKACADYHRRILDRLDQHLQDTGALTPGDAARTRGNRPSHHGRQEHD